MRSTRRRDSDSADDSPPLRPAFLLRRQGETITSNFVMFAVQVDDVFLCLTSMGNRDRLPASLLCVPPSGSRSPTYARRHRHPSLVFATSLSAYKKMAFFPSLCLRRRRVALVCSALAQACDVFPPTPGVEPTAKGHHHTTDPDLILPVLEHHQSGTGDMGCFAPTNEMVL